MNPEIHNAINNFCNIITEKNIIPEQHMGPLLLMIGILTNDIDRVNSTFENYPDIDIEKPLDTYVIDVLNKLGLLPNDSDEVDSNIP